MTKYYLGAEQNGLRPYVTDASDNSVIYHRWSHSDGVIYIERETIVNDVITREKTLSTWANKATATYIPLYASLDQLEG